jgi:Ca2+-binding EF-hand superfamily protein
MRSLFALVGLLAAAAAAQAGSDESHRHRMAAVDPDGDGVVTRDEAKAHPWLADKFDSVDANKDGGLDKNELTAMHDAHRAEMQARGEERWKAADTDGNGSISRAEAEASKSWVAGQFDKLDADKDGQLTRDEMKAARKEGHERMREHAVERFRTADANGDGGIDLAEAQTGMPKLAEKFSTVDANNDGKVTPAELKALRHQ